MAQTHSSPPASAAEITARLHHVRLERLLSYGLSELRGTHVLLFTPGLGVFSWDQLIRLWPCVSENS